MRREGGVTRTQIIQLLARFELNRQALLYLDSAHRPLWKRMKNRNDAERLWDLSEQLIGK